jgi:hypothetical protein
MLPGPPPQLALAAGSFGAKVRIMSENVETMVSGIVDRVEVPGQASAFPVPRDAAEAGIPIRTYIATAALAASIARVDPQEPLDLGLTRHREEIAHLAVLTADALIQELAK